ncbi:PREDICTED: uncharacterized protein LOC109486219 isoform X2 [Branchiostoma belcheri]|uniref:Uncharacterized protein LOC109486219 isoform X2 n=1 Tax=Branchiostoma belcheri TaxID=7741 RepID=A0A6P5AU01_BRABE|nr:PREDICTED: uncharacterized protein LOC109486219 isoform X2 [Branchiostoma belcheri]
MFSLTVLLVAVTVASAADTTQPTTTQPTTTWTTTGCESYGFSWPGQHTLGETWREQFEGHCKDCVCLATGKQCEPCPPRACYSKPWDQYQYPPLAVGETAIIELIPGFCVLCECQDYSASCSSYPCDGIIA